MIRWVEEKACRTTKYNIGEVAYCLKGGPRCLWAGPVRSELSTRAAEVVASQSSPKETKRRRDLPFFERFWLLPWLATSNHKLTQSHRARSDISEHADNEISCVANKQRERSQ